MTVWLIFVVLPVVLIVLSFRIRPLRDVKGDVQGSRLFARGLFGSGNPELKADERSVREETEPRPFRLD
ncbi:hypothetical protein MF271_15230 [Deinococcus sp. KNUC1210]|uniref:hypothetical protein n=1 Tax=Deinococcus sp. KNUC1210 TaxID=2917691 RepID=UPI001EF11232|nr:hypothetical protein [Deinococcus sp. KNUC1210]ULH15279.1 hypothetical protein MF271_15230 [Deinococcus sp. KNUC1210]